MALSDVEKKLGRKLTKEEIDLFNSLPESDDLGVPGLPDELVLETASNEPLPIVDPSEVIDEKTNLPVSKQRMLQGVKLGGAALVPTAVIGGGVPAIKGVAANAGLLGSEGAKAGLGALGADLAAGAYPLYVAGRGAYDINKALKDDKSALATALRSELTKAKEATLESPENIVHFPGTASEGAKIVGEAAIPKTAVNLADTLVSALTGGIKGVAGGIGSVLGVADKGIAETQKALRPLTNSTAVKILGAIAGASDKAPEANLISTLLTGKKLPGTMQATDLGGLNDLFNKPYSQLKPDEKEFVKSNWDTYLKHKNATGFDKDTFKIQQDLRKDYEIAAKPFKESAGSFDKLTNTFKSMTNTPTRAQSLAMGYNFMKTLDPGSTVRESEFSMLGDMGMLPTNMQALYNQFLRQGAFFDKKAATDMYNVAKNAFDAALAQQVELENFYGSQALKIPGTRVEDIIVPYFNRSKSTLPVQKIKDPQEGMSDSEKMGIAPATGIQKEMDRKAKEEREKKAKEPKIPTAEEKTKYEQAKSAKTEAGKKRAAEYIKQYEAKYGK